MDRKELIRRTTRFSLQVREAVRNLPLTMTGEIIRSQVGMAVKNVYAYCHAACNVRSHAEFLAKIDSAEKEADEMHFWLELAMDSQLMNGAKALY